jgi:hypothetical protein
MNAPRFFGEREAGHQRDEQAAVREHVEARQLLGEAQDVASRE